MKINLFFKKKLYIPFIILIMLLFFTLFNLKYYNEQTTETFNLTQDNTTIKKDFNGDGENDILYVKKHKNKHCIQINIKGKSYELIQNNNLKTLGHCNSTWPMRITIKDLNRDNIPEIIIQSSEENVPIQNIFSWHIDDFKNIFNNKNNIVGFVDISNNKSPKFISGNFYDSEIYFKNYIVVNNSLMHYTECNMKNFLGKDTINNFINFLQGDESLKKNVILSIDEGLIDTFFQLTNNGYNFKFQDATFEDIKSNVNGDINHIKWKLNFKGTSGTEIKNFTFTLQLRENLKGTQKDYTIYYFDIENLSEIIF